MSLSVSLVQRPAIIYSLSSEANVVARSVYLGIAAAAGYAASFFRFCRFR